MSLQHSEQLESAEVNLDPAKVELPAKLDLSLYDNGEILLGGQIISPACEDGRAKYEQIKKALEEGRYKLKILLSGQMELETY